MFYLLVFIGTLIEGELAVAVAIYFYLQGHYSVWFICFFAGLGAFSGDLVFYLWGWKKGTSLAHRFPVIGGGVLKIFRTLSAYPSAMILILRFQIMMRSIGFFSLGSMRGDKRRHLVFIFFSAWIWSAAVVYLLVKVLPVLLALLNAVMKQWR